MSREPHAHRRRWPSVVAVLVLVLGAGVLVVWLTLELGPWQVTLGQAEARAHGLTGGSPDGNRPSPGVYHYTGSGTEHLTLPPLSQSEGPTIPGTVTLQGKNCWVFRVDYSTHHWQTWDYCHHGADTWEAGGVTWQLWSIGPMNVTDLSTFHCVPRSMALPAGRTVGQQWHSRCTGVNSAVKGVTVSAGPYRFLGDVWLTVGHTRVEAAHFLRVRTDGGSQTGSEHSAVWFDVHTGLPLREVQSITITTATEFGTSTYTQHGEFSLVSLTPHR